MNPVPIKARIRKMIADKSYYGTASLSYNDVEAAFYDLIDAMAEESLPANAGQRVTSSTNVFMPAGVKRLYIDPAAVLTDPIHVTFPDGAQDGDEVWIIFGGQIKPTLEDSYPLVLNALLYIEVPAGQTLFKEWDPDQHGDQYAATSFMKWLYIEPHNTWLQIQ